MTKFREELVKFYNEVKPEGFVYGDYEPEEEYEVFFDDLVEDFEEIRRINFNSRTHEQHWIYEFVIEHKDEFWKLENKYPELFDN